ncbi:hypothetical protein JG688_00008938 [Phytophthora aleatoria]|uniref:Uncharacterized protein n=1 Tax=Phytophthora aleatoria TaxID=2496075 RepID=A0A8J5M703_9STRA|nr:hypothetical protein JG688_00008938 [Phytophthora aleatoria]
MLSPHGLSSITPNIKCRREKRYYKLLCLFADQRETIAATQLQSSRIYSSICEEIMRCTEILQEIEVWAGGTGKRKSMKYARCCFFFKTSLNKSLAATPDGRGIMTRCASFRSM